MNKLILSTLVVTIAAAPSSWAKKPDREAPMWAKVTHVQPITRVIEQRSPQQQCWNEPVRYRQPSNYTHSSTGAILGTIVGGVIGHNVSRNRGAGTVVGAMIGASVGNELSRPNYHRSPNNVYYENQRRCQVSESVSYQRQVLGYEVWYRYQGNEYKTEMDHHPGNKIRIRLSVQPY